MPRMRTVMLAILAATAASACGFDADYRGGAYRCSDGVCPTGLACVAGTCVAPVFFISGSSSSSFVVP